MGHTDVAAGLVEYNAEADKGSTNRRLSRMSLGGGGFEEDTTGAIREKGGPSALDGVVREDHLRGSGKNGGGAVGGKLQVCPLRGEVRSPALPAGLALPRHGAP